MIETTRQLEQLMVRAHATEAVGLDTEFIWERTYYPRLGLIQLALAKDECFLIDPLAIKDLSSLGELLRDEKVVKIFHDGSQDLAILRKATGVDPQNIFDTRLAAGFAGLPSILSLLVLVEKIVHVSLNKSQTRTNWLKRPLSSKQIKYGLDDVRYLRELRRILLADMHPEARAWLGEEVAKFDHPASYMGIDDTERYTKLRGVNRLKRPGLAIACGLAEWREKEARRQNKPRGHIIHDDVVLHIADQQIQGEDDLHLCEGLSAKSVARYGATIMDIVNTALGQDDSTYPELLGNGRLNKTDDALLRKLQGWIKQESELYGLDPALLGNKAELKNFIKKAAASSRQNEGWRKSFLAGVALI